MKLVLKLYLYIALHSFYHSLVNKDEYTNFPFIMLLSF